MKIIKTFFAICLCFGLQGFLLNAQENSVKENIMPNVSNAQVQENSVEADLSLNRVALFSSGVGYFEHSGTVAPSSDGQARILLPFDSGAVNDALKSLVINDPVSASPSVRYASQNTTERTLKSLKVDLSGAPGIGEILNGLKGAELEVSAPNPIQGRIIGVEFRRKILERSGTLPVIEERLSLFTAQGIRVIDINNISAFRFTDEKINADFTRALDLIMASRDENTRSLLVNLPGVESRDVALSYVIPAPVWKVSYRLDLSGEKPFLQGWAIVDNDSDTDWKDVELSLVIGRPVSFIQTLYPPFRLSRPTLPLAIAGIAESRTYESGYGSKESADFSNAVMADEVVEEMLYEMEPMAMAKSAPMAARQSAAVTGGAMQTAAGNAAGDQFEFTLKNPVTLERRQSAMLPLVEGSVNAEKMLVFSGSRASSGGLINPAISVELNNTSGMKLPAGPITVYDSGIYAGDALIEFFPENEKRFISFGEDLSVTGSASFSGSRYVTTVSIAGGVMTINRRQTHERVYTIRNASEETKKLVIEHPIITGAELTEPKTAEDRTSNLYRFNRNLSAKETLVFKVCEETPISERVTLMQLRPDVFLSYATNQEIPDNVRSALNRAVELKKTADEAAASLADLENRKTKLVSDQDRIRRNLEAAGNTSPQGQDYLRRLTSIDSDIDKLNARIDTAENDAQNAKRQYESYVAGINI